LFGGTLGLGRRPLRGDGFLLLLLMRFVLLEIVLFRRRACAVRQGSVAASQETQAQLLRYVLVDRAGVGLLLRNAIFRQ
jgi:hypothetical protein